MDKISRRDFLKQVGAFIGASILPVSLAAPIVITDLRLIDGWWENLVTVKQIPSCDKDSVGISVSFDAERIFEFIELINEDGSSWFSTDGGTTWQNGLMEFQVGD